MAAQMPERQRVVSDDDDDDDEDGDDEEEEKEEEATPAAPKHPVRVHTLRNNDAVRDMVTPADDAKRDMLMRKKAKLKRCQEEKLLKEIQNACKQERDEKTRLEREEKMRKRQRMKKAHKPDPYKLVVMDDDSDVVRLRLLAVATIRKEADKGKPIIQRNMTELRILVDTISRIWSPYEKRIPTADDFVEFGWSARDAYRVYAQDLETWVDFCRELKPSRNNMTRASRWLDIPFLKQRYQVTGRMLHIDCGFTVDDLITQKLTPQEMVQLNINVGSLLDMGMAKREFFVFQFELLKHWIIMLGLTGEHLRDRLEVNRFEYHFLVTQRGWNIHTVNVHLGLSDAVAIERPAIDHYATPIVYSDSDLVALAAAATVLPPPPSPPPPQSYIRPAAVSRMTGLLPSPPMAGSRLSVPTIIALRSPMPTIHAADIQL